MAEDERTQRHISDEEAQLIAARVVELLHREKRVEEQAAEEFARTIDRFREKLQIADSNVERASERGATKGLHRSRADLALVLGVVGLFAAGTVATYIELVGINRELGGVLVKNEEFDRRLSALEEGQDAIEQSIVRLESQVLSRLDAIDARLSTLDQTIKGIQERADLKQ